MRARHKPHKVRVRHPRVHKPKKVRVHHPRVHKPHKVSAKGKMHRHTPKRLSAKAQKFRLFGA